MCAQSYLTLCDPMDEGPARLLYLWNFPGKSTGVGCHFLFQVIFPTQGLNPRFLPWQVDSLPLPPPGEPFNILFSIFKTQSFQHAIHTKLLMHCSTFVFVLSSKSSVYFILMAHFNSISHIPSAHMWLGTTVLDSRSLKNE